MKKRITLGEAIDILKANGQSKDLLKDYDSYSPGERVKLLHQIAGIDWNGISMVKNGIKKRSFEEFEPPYAIEVKDVELHRDEYHKRGQFLLRAGKVAAVMLAGGMETRLGIGKPKGELNIGKTRVLYVYQCLIDNLLLVSNMERAIIPLYVVTDESYRQQSEEFFKAHNYFGYPKDLITFCNQENNVCCDLKGNIFFDAPGHLAEAPNGNGGWFDSMEKEDLVVELDRKGIEWINVFSVDNVLQHIADPIFIGAVVLGGHDSGAKVVRKNSIFEKVGVFCNRGDHAAVVEYYEMDDVTKSLKDPDGELTYRFGVTLNYLFNVKKLKQCMEKHFPVHVIKKKIPYLNDEGDIISPKEPNGYKFETLVADMVGMMDDCLCFEVIRSKEFAPIKNPTGNDSPDSARKLLEENGVRL